MPGRRRETEVKVRCLDEQVASVGSRVMIPPRAAGNQCSS